MAYYAILAYRGPRLTCYHRRRRDAALKLFSDLVYDTIKAASLLDRPGGVAAITHATILYRNNAPFKLNDQFTVKLPTNEGKDRIVIRRWA